MKISVDIAAVNTALDKRFGTYQFTKNLLESLARYDSKNEYDLYSFAPLPAEIDEIIAGSPNFTIKVLSPRTGWMKYAVSVAEMSHKHDIFLALNQALPLATRSKIISFSHGLSFHYFPKLYPDSAEKMEKQVSEMIARSRAIVVSSDRVKKEMEESYPVDSRKLHVLPFGIPFDMTPGNPIQQKRTLDFMTVAMDHPIKNIGWLVTNFIKMKKENKDNASKLYLVGDFRRFHNPENGIYSTGQVNRNKLKRLYRTSCAYLSASFYESFNLPVLEALSQGCPVIPLQSAIVPELDKFTFTVRNSTGFRARMKQLSRKKENVQQKNLINLFSWKTYTEKLMKLYTKVINI